MKQIVLTFITIISIGFGATAQNVTIPDANFKAYLLGNTAINTNADTEIQASEASAFTGAIDCNGLSISDLTGIEYFTALTDLRCYNNSLTSLDVTQNTSLIILACYSNSLTNLDVTQNISLGELYCDHNSLSSLDVTQNFGLYGFGCSDNALTSLDLTQNMILMDVNCQSNSLTSLNIANGNNTNITSGFFFAANNPNLTCIQVDDVAYSTTNWAADIDAIASFSTNCSTTTGIKKLTNKINVSVYPNPVSSQLNIETAATIESIEIYDLLGKLIQTENTTSFSVQNLENGVYLLKIKTNRGLVSKQFIKAS